ncbi:citrate/2-methylcitrate synthase [Psychromicrobium sp. YIM B11713]|uniref:citrate/2-methylcitrate synthase n=1 Tax=Psychromicrobium sp. YIM B11713 TaxID=3145233 RepID=UPI00374E88BC
MYTNLEWYAATVMEPCGLKRKLFPPTFAAAQLLGWCDNVLEQADGPKIIRLSARYTGSAAPQPLPSSAEPFGSAGAGQKPLKCRGVF